jgi:surfeit locus 1 family protein
MESFNKKRISGVFFMFLLALLAFSLAVWQTFRALEKRDFIEKSDLRSRQTVKLNMQSLPSNLLTSENWDQRKVIVFGSWIPKTTIYLDNRSLESRPGVHVVTAFKLEDNKSVVWINRGWAPKLPGKTFDNKKFVNGEVYLPTNNDVVTKIEGIAYTNLMKRIELTTNSLILREGSLWQNLDWSALDLKLKKDSSFYYEKIWPFVLWQTTNSLDGLKRSLPTIKINVSKHIGYAVQWMLLCLVALFFAWRIGRK